MSYHHWMRPSLWFEQKKEGKGWWLNPKQQMAWLWSQTGIRQCFPLVDKSGFQLWEWQGRFVQIIGAIAIKNQAMERIVVWNYMENLLILGRTKRVKVDNKVIRSRLIFLLLNQVMKVPKTLESSIKKRLRNWEACWELWQNPWVLAHWHSQVSLLSLMS